jgi:hypothetical protein
MSQIRELTATAVTEIALCLGYLGNCKKGEPVVDEDGSVKKGDRGFVLHALNVLVEALERFDVLTDEIPYLKSLASDLRKKYVKGSKRKLDSEDAEEIEGIAVELQAKFRETMVRRDFREIRPSSGRFDYSKLLKSGIHGFFSTDVIEKLPRRVVEDLEDALKSLAYDLPTPSVMISLRATEGILRSSYQEITGHPSGERNWNDISEALFEALKKMNVNNAGMEGYLSHIRGI